MPTLAQITEAHSKRITLLAARRDALLREATEARDRALSAVPACQKLYDDFERAAGDARDKQHTTELKAEEARRAALEKNSLRLAEALADAHVARRDADVAAFDQRRQAEADAEHEFLLALAAEPSKPSIDAQKSRMEKLERARKQLEQARAAAQELYRQARDAALIAESRGSRDADRAFAAASKVGEQSANTARVAAQQVLARALAAIPEAAAEVEAWRKRTAAILADYERAESEEFERFHDEVQALRA
jgi:hypothetical protein